MAATEGWFRLRSSRAFAAAMQHSALRDPRSWELCSFHAWWAVKGTGNGQAHATVYTLIRISGTIDKAMMHPSKVAPVVTTSSTMRTCLPRSFSGSGR